MFHNVFPRKSKQVVPFTTGLVQAKHKFKLQIDIKHAVSVTNVQCKEREETLSKFQIHIIFPFGL